MLSWLSVADRRSRTGWSRIVLGLFSIFLLLSPVSPSSSRAETEVDTMDGIATDGLWRTVNGLESQPTWDVSTYWCNPSERTEIGLYAATTDGVYKCSCSDPNSPCQQVGDDLDDRVILAVSAFPQNPERVLAAVNDAQGEAIMRSTNGGVDWEQVSDQGILAFARKPDEPQIVLAGGEEGQMWRSPNGGATWNSTAGWADDSPITSIVFHPNDSQVVYAGTEGNGVYRSDDGGIRWHKRSTTAGELELVEALCIFPHKILAGTYNGYIYKSIDGGSKWSQIERLAPGIYALANFEVGDVAFAGTYGEGAWQTTDEGDNWESLPPLPGNSRFVWKLITIGGSSNNSIKFQKSYPILLAATARGVWMWVTHTCLLPITFRNHDFMGTATIQDTQSNNGMILIGQEETSPMSFRSSQNSTVENRPRLVITHYEPRGR